MAAKGGNRGDNSETQIRFIMLEARGNAADLQQIAQAITARFAQPRSSSSSRPRRSYPPCRGTPLPRATGPIPTCIPPSKSSMRASPRPRPVPGSRPRRKGGSACPWSSTIWT